uniref:Uncharacterized protein n=1 Tax=Ananas comosus var. bracteatus TaxID=296719 RepID=A0A6V7P0T1_ANACO|nr:unnamed protein product [Ananas comosus var. bracteatus]
MAESEAPMAAVNVEEEKGPRHYQIEHPYVCIGEPRHLHPRPPRPVETLGSSSSFDAVALLVASASSSDEKTSSARNAWFDVVASFPAAAHLASFLPGSLLDALSFDLDRAIAERPHPYPTPTPPPSSTSRSSPSSTRTSTTTGSSPSAISSTRSAPRRCTAESWIS